MFSSMEICRADFVPEKKGQDLSKSPGKYEKENMIYTIKKGYRLCLIINIPEICDEIVREI